MAVTGVVLDGDFDPLEWFDAGWSGVGPVDRLVIFHKMDAALRLT